MLTPLRVLMSNRLSIYHHFTTGDTAGSPSGGLRGLQ